MRPTSHADQWSRCFSVFLRLACTIPSYSKPSRQNLRRICQSISVSLSKKTNWFSAEPNRFGNRLSLGQCNNTYQKSQFATLLMELGARHRKARAQGDTTMKPMPMLVQDGNLSLEIWSSEM